MFESVKKFLGPVPKAVQGETKTEEVSRSGILGALSGFTIWTVISVMWEIFRIIISDPSFATFLESLETLFKDKNYIAILIGIGTFVLDVLRRRYLHGR